MPLPVPPSPKVQVTVDPAGTVAVNVALAGAGHGPVGNIVKLAAGAGKMVIVCVIVSEQGPFKTISVTV